MKAKDKFKVREVREIESLLMDNADFASEESTAKVLTIITGTEVKAEEVLEMDEVDVVELVSDYWLYKKKLNENIMKKLSVSTPEQT